LYFDINKTATFKKTLILTSIAVTFNIVAIIFGFISNVESKYYAEILVFSILASVCLLLIVARLVLLILCKKINNIYESKGDGKKLLALILSSVLFVFVFGGAVIKESIVQEEFFYVPGYIESENRWYATITGYSGDKKEIVIP
jgi:glucan phosphoethanolaminetransferase (alkaline phosphatase superfamily)